MKAARTSRYRFCFHCRRRLKVTAAELCAHAALCRRMHPVALAALHLNDLPPST